jgi:uncharacterized membrane protein YgcG
VTYCETIGPCQRPGCGRPACDHAIPSPHVLHDRQTWCEGYVPSEAQSQGFGEFEGGGGSGGGGGASGGW